LAVIYNSTDGADIYENGVKLALSIDDTPHVGQTANDKFVVGGDDILAVALNPNGGNDELRIASGTNIVEAWVQTSYNNQSDFPNWAAAGTPTDLIDTTAELIMIL
jgi:hypothetical protein